MWIIKVRIIESVNRVEIPPAVQFFHKKSENLVWVFCLESCVGIKLSSGLSNKEAKVEVKSDAR